MSASGVLVLSLLSLQTPIRPPGNVLPENQPRFAASVSAVHLDVAVTGPSQLFLPGLTIDDFEVYEDGILQQVSFFSANEASPLTLVLLLDASTSIRSAEGDIKKAASRLVREMSPRDKAAVVVFSDEILASTHFTPLPDPLLKAIGSLRGAGKTALYDAILYSLDKLSPVEGRKALLVFTDGSDSRPMPGGSKASDLEAIESGKLSEVTIYTVGFVAQGRGVNERFLERLSSETGGRTFFPVNAEHLDRSFSAVGEELHTGYRLAYTPRNGDLDGAWRSIEVRVPEHADLVVRTRRGYYAVARESGIP